MNGAILVELRDKWNNLQADILAQPKGHKKFRKRLSSLLEDCITFGKQIREKPKRTRLQWIAREIGDTIFQLTNEYPDTTILPAEPAIPVGLATQAGYPAALGGKFTVSPPDVS